MVRRATIDDARAIHEAHMLSIQTVCIQEHTAEEIRGWGGRPYNEAQRVLSIQKNLVWVVELNGKIEGYAAIQLLEKDGQRFGYIAGLYLSLVALGRGYGRQMFDLMMDAAKEYSAQKVKLESTLTAHGFYKKMGFLDAGPMMYADIGGSQVRCIPMEFNF